MSKRFSREHARRRRASLSNNSTQKTKGNGQHVEHSQAPITRAYQSWRKTSDVRASAIRFREFEAARPDENADYVPLSWSGFLGKLADRKLQAESQERAVLEATRMEAEERERRIQDVLADPVKVAQALEAAAIDFAAKKVRKPRAKKVVAAEV